MGLLTNTTHPSVTYFAPTAFFYFLVGRDCGWDWDWIGRGLKRRRAFGKAEEASGLQSGRRAQLTYIPIYSPRR